MSTWYTWMILTNQIPLKCEHLAEKYLLRLTRFCFILKARHLIDEMDLNSDRKLSEEEILENQDLFLTSEATDYGRQLHDEYFYHDELWSPGVSE